MPHLHSGPSTRVGKKSKRCLVDRRRRPKIPPPRSQVSDKRYRQAQKMASSSMTTSSSSSHCPLLKAMERREWDAARTLLLSNDGSAGESSKENDENDAKNANSQQSAAVSKGMALTKVTKKSGVSLLRSFWPLLFSASIDKIKHQNVQVRFHWLDLHLILSVHRHRNLLCLIPG